MSGVASNRAGAARGRGVLVLLAILLATQLSYRVVARRPAAEEGASRALATVFSAEEQVAASLLGGFRAVLLNVLWVRIKRHQEQGQFLELPLLLQAVEDLQGVSPFLYRVQAQMMMLDLPRALSGEREARWRWIERGVALLDRGVERFGDDHELLDEAGFVYYIRFHPYKCPDDRARFLEDRRVNPRGEDPLDIAAGFLERAVSLEGHGLDADVNLLEIEALRLERLLGARSEQFDDPEVARRVRAALAETSRREAAAALVGRVRAQYDHLADVHLPHISKESSRRSLQGWIASGRAAIAAFEEAFLGPPEANR